MKEEATRESYERLIAAEPTLVRVARLADCAPGRVGHTLFHAGPPYSAADIAPAPVLNAAAATALVEGWAETREEALTKLASGTIKLASAQDIGLVTPLAFVVGPSTFCLEVIDSGQPELRRLAPLNDGPLPDALRFGTGGAAGIELLERLNTSVGPDLARHLSTEIPLLPLLAVGLAGGDDLHGHVAATQAALLPLFDDGISADSRAFMTDANQFVLNVIMAAAALMIGAGSGVSESDLVVAAGGNGVSFGYKLAAQPDTWITRPATRPQGPKFEGSETQVALPAIGDSAVIDALGFGAACLRFCPTLSQALAGKIEPSYFTSVAHDAFVGPHPALHDSSIRVGLDLMRPRSCLGVMLGMVEATGKGGIIGRGVASWPEVVASET